MLSDIVIANVLASACLVILIYIFDINEKEPPWTLVRIYAAAILATFLFGKLKGFLFAHYRWEFPPLFDHFVVAGFFEELLKLIVVLIFVYRLKSLDEETDGIIYYLIVAAGFAVLENLGYSFDYVFDSYRFGKATGSMGGYYSALQNIVVFRTLSGHLFINVVSGYFLGLSRRRGLVWMVPGFFASVLLHGLWNLSVARRFLPATMIFLFVLDVVLFRITVRRSFYFKFLRRLRERIADLIRSGRETRLDGDVLILLETNRRRMRVLRQMQSNSLKKAAAEIVRLLPSRWDEAELYGQDGIVERLLRINGILAGGEERSGLRNLAGLFLTFSVSGFMILMLLMNVM